MSDVIGTKNMLIPPVGIDAKKKETEIKSQSFKKPFTYKMSKSNAGGVGQLYWGLSVCNPHN